MINIDINKLTTQKGNINSGILTAIRQDRFIVSDLDIDDLIPSEDNFFQMSGIESLKENIEEFGLQQNLLVMRRPDKKYEIISGHRRREACRQLVQEGKKKFRWLPCRILPEIDGTTKNILLITMNTENRDTTMADLTEAVERLKILYADYKKNHPEFKGRVRDIIAKDLGMSPATIGRHEKISKNLIPEAKEVYQSGYMNFSAAEELSKMSPEEQKAIYEETGGAVTAKEVRQHQEPAAEPENMIIDGFTPEKSRPSKDSKICKDAMNALEDIQRQAVVHTTPVVAGDVEQIRALATLKKSLEKEYEKHKKLLGIELEEGNEEKAKIEKAIMQYIETSLLPKIADDLFRLNGQEIF